MGPGVGAGRVLPSDVFFNLQRTKTLVMSAYTFFLIVYLTGLKKVSTLTHNMSHIKKANI